MQHLPVRVETIAGPCQAGKKHLSELTRHRVGRALEGEFWGLPARLQLPLVNVRAEAVGRSG